MTSIHFVEKGSSLWTTSFDCSVAVWKQSKSALGKNEGELKEMASGCELKGDSEGELKEADVSQGTKKRQWPSKIVSEKRRGKEREDDD